MATAALITPRDLLAPAGEGAILEVEVERRWLTFLDPPLRGAEIEVQGVGRARTGEDGVARMHLGTPAPATYRYRVRNADGAWTAPEAEVLVRVVDRATPVFITDVDQTIADVSSAGFVIRRNAGVRPVAGAREALEEIARAMQIVYLSARDHIFTVKTKEWLRTNGFPEAPVYLRRGTRFWTVSPKDHKLARLAELRGAFPDIRWGVGDLREDAEAYAAHGIPPILLSPRPPARLPAGTALATAWREIVDLIK